MRILTAAVGTVALISSIVSGLDEVGYGSTVTDKPSTANKGTFLEVYLTQDGNRAQQPTSSARSAHGGTSTTGDTSPHYAETVSAEDALARFGTDACVPDAAAVDACGIAQQPVKPSKPGKSGPRTPTLTDLASFRPATPSLTVEPGGFGIVGRPTNFVASASPQTLTGRLFDLPVTVRFTPAAYRFDYGDGTTRTTTTGGTTWHTADTPLFTRTATSHTYTRKTLVTARATVAYTAHVAFTGHPGWYHVTGYVLAPTPTRQFQLYVARTVLVEHTCDEDPTGPGCPATP